MSTIRGQSRASTESHPSTHTGPFRLVVTTSMGKDQRPELGLVCRSCGEWFSSLIQMDRESFDKIRLDRLTECCSHCGHRAQYDKAEYGFRSE